MLPVDMMTVVLLVISAVVIIILGMIVAKPRFIILVESLVVVVVVFVVFVLYTQAHERLKHGVTMNATTPQAWLGARQLGWEPEVHI